MHFSGIRPTEGFYSYNINKIQEQRNQQIQEAQEQQNRAVAEEQKLQQEQQSEAVGAREQSFTAYDYAQNYVPEAVYELKGSESDIMSLDMEKAISSMQKDQLLMQYQFFVGSSRQDFINSENPELLRPKENFELQYFE